MPLVDVGTSLQVLTATDNLFIAERIASHHLSGRLLQFEGERCDVDGNSHIRVLWIDDGELVALSERLRHLHLLTGGKQDDQ